MKPPALRTILLSIHVIILIIPLAAIGFLRLYENALLRQTEARLNAQGVLIAAAYRRALIAGYEQAGESLHSLFSHSLEAQEPWRSEVLNQKHWRLAPPRLAFGNEEVLPHSPPARSPQRPARPPELAAGDQINALINDAHRATGTTIDVVDPNGTIVATTGTQWGRGIHHRTEVRRALAGEQVSLLRRSPSAPPTFVSALIDRGAGTLVVVSIPVWFEKRIAGAVVLANQPPLLSEAIAEHRFLFAGTAVVILAAVLFLIRWSTSTISRPVSQLVQQARNALRGRPGAQRPLRRPKTREIAQLSQAIARLAAALNTRGEYVQTFAAHLSEAFDTPLAAFRRAVEVLRDHHDTMNAGEKQAFLRDLAVDVDGLERLVKRLLDLAQAETLKVGSHHTAIKPVLGQLQRSYAARHLELQLPAMVDASVNMEETLFVTIVEILLENALQAGAHEMRVILNQDAETLTLRFKDNGEGIAADASARIFEPFFTTRRKTGGSGLGLAVAQKLARAHGGELLLAATDQHGSEFQLKLPREKRPASPTRRHDRQAA